MVNPGRETVERRGGGLCPTYRAVPALNNSMPVISRRATELRALRPQQSDGFRYCRRTRHPALLMEMRLGKTLTAIRWMLSLPRKRGEFRRFLVLAPLSVLETWERELKAENQRFYSTYGLSPKRKKLVIASALSDPHDTFLLMSYEGLLAQGEVYISRRGRRKRYLPGLALWPWTAAVLDESTRIRNAQAQITEVCIRGFRPAEHRMILTGLITPESLLDTVCQFLYLHGEFLGMSNYWEIRNRYFQRFGFDWVPRKGTRAKFKAEVHRLSFVRTAKQCGLSSELIQEPRYVEMNATQKAMYRQVCKEFAIDCKDGERLQTKWKPTQRLWLGMIAGGFDPKGNLINSAKTDELIELIKGELFGKKIVVWFKFRHELENAVKRIKKAGVSCVGILGGEPLRIRNQKLRQIRGKTRVLCIMEKCAKFGADYSFTDTCIYYSNEWGNEDRQQSMRRIVAYEKGRSHLVIDLITRNSVDVLAVEALKNKSIESKVFMMKVEEFMGQWRA